MAYVYILGGDTGMKRSSAPGVDNGNVEKKQAVPVTVNVTIKNYFAAATGPAPAPKADAHPPNLFPQDERSIRARHHSSGIYYVIRSGRSGELYASCCHCPMLSVEVERFAPKACLHNNRKRAAFFEALSDYYRAYNARDYEAAAEARQRVVDNRTLRCPSCQESGGKLTTPEQACKDFYDKAREAACLAQNGCRHHDCAAGERGPQAACVLQGDHIDKSTKLCREARPGNYKWWAWNGGVSALRAELPKLQWPCAFCHHLEDTSDAANRCGDPKLMPKGKWNGTPEEVKQYNSRLSATIRYPKHQYVDAAKMAVGACVHCHLAVSPDNVWCFHWDHLDETTKLKGEDTPAGESGGVGGLVHNHTKAAALDAKGFKEMLDAEMAKCQLLCANCHHRKTNKYTMRE